MKVATLQCVTGAATVIAVSVGKFFGGDLFGFSTLALLVALSDTNGGMFMALTSVMGDKEDAGGGPERGRRQQNTRLLDRVRE